MKPHYDDGKGIVIYHGDCRDVVPAMVEFDLVLADPPYGVSYKTNWRSRGDPLRVGVRNDGDLGVVAEAWPIIMRSLKENRHWYAFASPSKIAEAAGIFVGYKHVIAWDKGDRGTVGDLECGFGEAWEAIFYGMKGRRPLIGPRPMTVVRQDWSGLKDLRHPTVKPVGLLARFVGMSTEPGEVVLDPFMGSGTTLRAAKDLGRGAVGIEIEERYCEIAAKRLGQEMLL